MNDRARERIAEWETVPFGGGVAGLNALAERAFTGAVVAGPRLVLLLNGKVIHRVGGALGDFPDGGTAHRAPDDGLVLLFAMWDGEVTSEDGYYSERTPLTEVHGSLEEAGFVGYVELSENVLSGDYYVVYYGGRSLPVAFVGASERLYTGDDAFDLAADEVGIYQVRAVEVDVEELPAPPDEAEPASDRSPQEPPSSPEEPEVVGDRAGAADPPSARSPGDSGDPEPGDDGDGQVDADRPVGVFRYEPEDARSAEDLSPGVASDESVPEGPADGPTEAHPEADVDEGDEQTTLTGPSPPEGQREARETPEEADDPEGWWSTVEGPAGLPPVDESDLPGRSIPSVDPDRTASETDSPPRGDGPVDTGEGSGPQDEDAHEPTGDDRVEPEAPTAESPGRKGLEAEVAELREELETMRTAGGEAPGVDAADGFDRTMAADEALSGTHLFVRYRNPGGATLEAALGDAADREAFAENLLLERHAIFEDDDVGVDGVPYGRFVEDRLELAVARWLVDGLAFDLRDAGLRDGVRDLLEVLPKVDRVDFRETVDGADDHRFDLVARDRMGAPLVVVDLHQARTPADREPVADLASAATAVAEAHPDLAGALMVTRSFFEAGAAELVEEVTGGGLFGSGGKASYVRVARGVGYHLCLVEFRSETPHVTVPSR